MYLADFCVHPGTPEGAPRSERDAALYHDADTDRTALHQRWADFCESDEGKAWLDGKHSERFDSFEFRQPDGPCIHTIVVTFTRESATAKEVRNLKAKAIQAFGNIERLRWHLSGTAAALDTLTGDLTSIV